MSDEELRRLFAEMRQVNSAEFAEMRRHFEESHAETRRHFEVTSERLENKIELVAEAVIQIDTKIDREIGTLRGEMRQGFADTHALIRFSYGDLDQRLKALE